MRMSLLGELTVTADSGEIALPSSRKTRAMLGYLAATGRPIRRERLCELFWDLPDDPRASLRWALSKIRKVVDRDGNRRIIADRERVTLALDDIYVELRHIWVRLNDDPPLIPPPELRDMAKLFVCCNHLIKKCILAFGNICAMPTSIVHKQMYWDPVRNVRRFSTDCSSNFMNGIHHEFGITAAVLLGYLPSRYTNM